ncbi:MAG TPA: alpha/beta fold hydrolase [Candidatus Methylomirabilis sp.]
MKPETILAAFDAEAFGYWIPRLVADGVDYNDIEAVRGRLTRWEDWPRAWAERGAAHEVWARESLAKGHRLTGGEALVRASLCYHFGQIIAFHDAAEKADLQRRKVEAFREAAPLLRPPAERLEFTWRRLTLPAYLRLPPGARPAPCVVLIPGLDATKEDFHSFTELCLRRGLGTFAFDGPGQGEARAQSPLVDGYEGAILAAVDALAARPEIDARRIALLGRSLGGHYALRAAAADRRVAAAVAFGGLFDLSFWERMPPLTREGFRQATGAATEQEARRRLANVTLEGCLGFVACPVLVVHGKRDAIIPWQQAQRIVEEFQAAVTLLLDEDGVHCCHNHATRYRPAMADWLATILKAEG